MWTQHQAFTGTLAGLVQHPAGGMLAWRGAISLTPKFSFISPSLLVIVMPLLALLPIALVLACKCHPARRNAVRYGGARQDVARVMTTALTFSNALRTF